MPHLRVFEIVRDSDTDTGISFFEVDLPTPWARSHAHAEVALREDEYFGWGATLVGDGEQPLIGFPWYDHVDQMLVDPDGELPPDLADGSWNDIEQGWWGSIVVDGGDVYLAEADFDALRDVSNPADLVLVRPGVVTVGGVELLWNRVTRALTRLRGRSDRSLPRYFRVGDASGVAWGRSLTPDRADATASSRYDALSSADQ